MKEHDSCPSCEKGNVIFRLERREFEYEKSLMVIEDCPIFRCNNCDEKFVTPELAETYKNRLEKFFDEVRKMNDL